MDLKSEVLAQLVPKIQLICGPELGEEIASLLAVELRPFDFVKSSREMVVYDGSDKGMIGRFFIAKEAIGLSPRSIKFYKQTIKDFLLFTKKHIADITTEDIRIFLTYKKNMGISSCSQDNIRRNLSSFFTFLNEEGLIEKNPIVRIKKIRQAIRLKESFTEQELETIRSSAVLIRDKAIIEFLISTACRVSELVSVNIADVDFHNEQVMVRGKGGKYRWLYLNARSIVALKAYLDSRTDLSEALFVSGYCGTNRIRAAYIRNILHGIEKKTGIKNIHPHRFRRTSATLALRRGMSIEQVSKILGHASMNTTTLYANSTHDDLRMAHRKYLP